MDSPTQPDAPAYHWTPANQRAFLEELADCGSVHRAAKAVSMSDSSAYRLRTKKEGTAFAIGWDAALQIARARLQSDLMDRAIYGQEDVAVRDKETNTTTRQRKDNRLGMWLVGRIDTRIAAQGDLEAALSRLVAQDFEAFLGLIETSADAGEITAFLTGQMDLRRSAKNAHEYDLSQFCALFGFQPEPEESEADDDVSANQFDVCEGDEGVWYTDYPPPPGFRGEEYGSFGDYSYRRELSPQELALVEAEEAEIAANDLAEAIAERDSHFGFEPIGVDAEIGDEEDADEPDDGMGEPFVMNRKMRRMAAAFAAKNPSPPDPQSNAH